MNSYTPPPPPPSSFGAPQPMSGQPIPNYLVQSILVTLCCCMPLGIVAIIFAAQVNTKLQQGDYAGASDASSKAKMFCYIGAGLGLVAVLISFLVNGAAILSQLGR